MTSAIIQMDPGAESRWASYLDEVRQALSPLSDSDLDDIIEELESHLRSDLDDDKTLLSEEDVTAVIDRLGSPRNMAEAYGIASPQRDAVSSLDLSLLFTSLILLVIGTFVPVSQIVLIPVGVVLARTAMQKPEVMASSYRFLGYPALGVGYLTLLVLALLWPLIPVLPIAATGGLLPQLLPEVGAAMERESGSYWIAVWLLTAIIVGLWWLLLSRLVAARASFLNHLFQPFTPKDGYSITAIRRTLRFAATLLVIAAVAILALLGIF